MWKKKRRPPKYIECLCLFFFPVVLYVIDDSKRKLMAPNEKAYKQNPPQYRIWLNFYHKYNYHFFDNHKYDNHFYDNFIGIFMNKSYLCLQNAMKKQFLIVKTEPSLSR